MNKKLTWMAISLFVVLGLLLGVFGCAPASTKATELKWTTWSTPTGTMSQCQVWYFDEVEKRTNGRVKVVPYWSGSLTPRADTMEALLGGHC
ncbi:hypothetical protein ACFLVN_01820 [Chloroflexota bacterium]